MTPKRKDAEGKRPQVPLDQQVQHLIALNGKVIGQSGHIYSGSVDPVVVQERRKKNKIGRKQARINRRKG